MKLSNRLILWFAILSLGLTPAYAQELVKSAAKTPAEPAETNVAERVRLLESELERQNGKLDQLQKTLLEQQQTIQVLLEKLSGSAQPAATAVNAKEAETPVAISPEPQQTPNVEQRLTKLEGQALKIGPVRVSG